MFCSNCGAKNNNGERFCKNCGTLLNNEQFQQMNMQNNITEQVVNNGQQINESQIMNNQIQNQSFQSNNVSSNYMSQAINPNMQKWAILSIVVPVIGIVWYWFIGLSIYLAIIIAAAGFGFAQKGEMTNKTLANIGKVLNGILCGMAIIMLIIHIIEIFV